MKFRSERDSLVERARHRRARRRWPGHVLAGPVRAAARVRGNHLVVTGTDLDLTIRVEQEVIGLEDGTCVVPARLTADIVRSLEPGR